MKLTEIFTEMEDLLDGCGFDEGWSDWLRDFADKAEHVNNNQQRNYLLHRIQRTICDGPFTELIHYLPQRDDCGGHPCEKLTHLISALDYTVRTELHE